MLGTTASKDLNFSLYDTNATITGGKISIAAGQGVSDRNIGAALNGTDVTYTADGMVVLNGTQRIGTLEATQEGRTLHVGGTYHGRTRAGDVTVDSIRGFGTITVEDADSAESSFTVNNLGTVKQNGSKGATITGATLTGASPDADNATIAGTSATELAQMASLTLDAAANIDLQYVTLADSGITANAGTSATISYGDDVKAVASTATPAEESKLTATTVQSGGSANGSLTVDVASSLLDANHGKTLTWTIFDGVTLDPSFTLQLGDVLTGIVNDGLPEVTLTVNGQNNVLSHESLVAQTRASNGYNLLSGFDFSAPATVMLTVTNIPEPATATLSLLALAALAARRRRKH